MGRALSQSGVLKQNQFKHPSMLGDGEVAEMLNMVTDKELFRPVRRGGLTQLGALSYSLNSAYTVLDGVVLACNSNGEIIKTTDGVAWSSLKTGLTAEAMRHAVINSKVYLSSENNSPMITDTSTAWDFGIEAPDVTKFDTYDKSGGVLPDLPYGYVFCFLTDEGQYGKPSRPIKLWSTGTPNRELYIKFNSAFSGVRSDIVSLVVFRSLSSGDEYYYHSTIDITEDGLTDNKPDDELDLTWTPPFQHSVTAAKAMAQHDERLFLANIKIPPVKAYEPYFARTSSSLTGYGSMNSPTLTSCTQTGGGLTAGDTYTYRAQWISKTGIRENVYFDDGAGGASLTIEQTVSSGDNAMEFTYMPELINRDDLGYRIYIYRLSKSLQPDYYLVASELGSGVPIYDTVAETALEVPSNAIKEETAYDEYPSATLFSEIGAPEQIPALNIIQVKPDDGDEIVDLIDMQEGVFVLKKNSLHFIYTYGTPQNWKVKILADNIGCDNSSSVQKMGDNVYFSKDNKIYRFPDALQTPLSLPISDTTDDMGQIYASAISTKYNWYIALASGATYNYAIVYDGDIQGWYVFTFSGLIKGIVEVRNGTLDGTLLFFSTTKTYKYDESATKDGTADIVTSITFRQFVDDLFRKFRILRVAVDAENGSTVYLTDDSTTESYEMKTDLEQIGVNEFSGTLNYTNKLQLKIKGASVFKGFSILVESVRR